MESKKGGRQNKPKTQKPVAKGKKKQQSSWLSWFRSSVSDQSDVDPKKQGEHKDNLRFVWGTVLAILSLAILIALVSHIFTGAEDMAHSGSKSYTYANWLGKYGYYVAHWMMDNTFGVSSILIPVLMLATSIRIMGIVKVRLHLWFLNCMIIMAWISAFIAYMIELFPDFFKNSYIIWGGRIGSNEVTCERLKRSHRQPDQHPPGNQQR